MNTAYWLSRDSMVTCTAIIHQFEMAIKSGFISLISSMSVFSSSNSHFYLIYILT